MWHEETFATAPTTSKTKVIMAKFKFALSEDVVKWPEWNALIKRLGAIDESLCWRKMVITLEMDSLAVVDVEYLPEPPEFSENQ
jgi:hypothetical protein